ncbi:MAG: hypothetical protein QFF03_19400, partial [Pseudomonadota bacterium]|nr:hypothetical protein [Pseudomonadota bacterium]
PDQSARGALLPRSGFVQQLRLMKNLARIILLLMIGIATAVLWMYCSTFLPHDLARGGASLVLADRCAGILTVFIMIVVPAIPIQSLFPRNAIMAALAVGWMPLAVGLLLAYPIIEGVPFAHRVEFAMAEGCVDWVAIVLGAWTISRLRQNAFEQVESGRSR